MIHQVTLELLKEIFANFEKPLDANERKARIELIEKCDKLVYANFLQKTDKELLASFIKNGGFS